MAKARSSSASLCTSTSAARPAPVDRAVQVTQRLVVEAGDDEQNGIGPMLDRFGQLPLVDHEILAQEGRDGLADGSEVVE